MRNLSNLIWVDLCIGGSERSIVLSLLLEELSRGGKAANCIPKLKHSKMTLYLTYQQRQPLKDNVSVLFKI